MIVVNGVMKSGTTLLVQYIRECGIEMEPGGLIAPAGRRLMIKGGKPWGEVRPLQEALSHYAPDRLMSGHINDRIDLSPHTVVQIIREPRNILVSEARWRAVNLDWQNAKQEPPVDRVRQEILKAIGSLLERLLGQVGWLKKADVVIRFEDFVERPETTAALLCSTLGIRYADPRGVLGDGAPWITKTYRGTWSGRHSDWRGYWNEKIEAAWRSAGGPGVAELYAY